MSTSRSVRTNVGWEPLHFDIASISVGWEPAGNATHYTDHPSSSSPVFGIGPAIDPLLLWCLGAASALSALLLLGFGFCFERAHAGY